MVQFSQSSMLATICLALVPYTTCGQNGLVLMQMTSRRKLTSIGSEASLDEAGYQKVAELKSNAEMKQFMKRFLEMKHVRLQGPEPNSEAAFEAMVPSFSGETGTQSFQKMSDALLTADWMGSDSPAVMSATQTASSQMPVLPPNLLANVLPGIPGNAQNFMGAATPQMPQMPMEPMGWPPMMYAMPQGGPPPMPPQQGPPMPPQQGPPMPPQQGPPMPPQQGPPMPPPQGFPMSPQQGPPMPPPQGFPMSPLQGPMPQGLISQQGPPMPPPQAPLQAPYAFSSVPYPPMYPPADPAAFASPSGVYPPGGPPPTGPISASPAADPASASLYPPVAPPYWR